MKKNKIFFKEKIYSLFLFLFLFSLSLSYFFYEAIYKDEYTVNGLSMFPTFENNEIIEVYHYLPKINNLNKNDIVIFKFTDEENKESVYIKRIIGKEGDTILIKDGKVFVNDIERDKNIYTDGNINITLKEKEYFVLGDNRKISNDSRHFGVITEKQILSFKND